MKYYIDLNSQQNFIFRQSVDLTSKNGCVFLVQMAKRRRTVKVTSPTVISNSTRPKKIRKRYKQTQVYDALRDINDGMSVKSAAKKWMIPRTTLNDLKLGHYKPETRPGPATILNATEELLLEQWIIEMSRRGLPLNRHNVMDSIQKIINDDGRSTPFKDNRPGSTWYKLFLQRHPLVTERYAESISRSRGALTEGCIRGWFDDAKNFSLIKELSMFCTILLNNTMVTKPASDWIRNQAKFWGQKVNKCTLSLAQSRNK